MTTFDSPAAVAGPLLSCFFILILVARRWYRAWTSPLNPAADIHWSVKWTGAWVWWKRVHEIEIPIIHEAHQRLGPVVRLGPNELSVVDVDGGLKPIYEGRMPKTDWYLVGRSYGQEPLFAIRHDIPSRQQKKLTAKPYTKTYLTTNKEWIEAQTNLAAELVAGLDRDLKTQPIVEFYDVFFAWGVDATASYVYGSGNIMNLLHDFKEAGRIRDAYFAQRTYQFVGVSLPIPSQVFSWLGYRPEIAWMRAMQDKAELARTSDSASQRDSVYEYMRQGLIALRGKQDAEKAELSATETARLAAEMQDQMLAGVDTSAGVLAACAWLLSQDKNLHWQQRIREEAYTQAGKTTSSDMPITDAVIKETLRLFGTLSGGPPRMTDRVVTLGPSGHQVTVPPGVTVHTQAYTLHRNEEVFPDADAFHPERWLDSPPEQLKEMDRWFWAFLSGPRKCLGENLAMSNMRVAVAAVWGKFETATTDTSHYTPSTGILIFPVPNKEGEYVRLAVRKVGS